MILQYPAKTMMKSRINRMYIHILYFLILYYWKRLKYNVILRENCNCNMSSSPSLVLLLLVTNIDFIEYRKRCIQLSMKFCFFFTVIRIFSSSIYNSPSLACLLATPAADTNCELSISSFYLFSSSPSFILFRTCFNNSWDDVFSYTVFIHPW